MASRILLRPLGLTTTITACSILAAPMLLQRPHTYLSESFPHTTSPNELQYGKHIRVPMRDVSRGGLNPRVVRQISTGSMLGMVTSEWIGSLTGLHFLFYAPRFDHTRLTQILVNRTYCWSCSQRILETAYTIARSLDLWRTGTLKN